MAQRLALLIGNNKYRDSSLSKLISPSQDVTQLGELLSDPDIGGFDHVETLQNQSFADTRRSIASFFTHKKRDDLLLLYFSGHGVLDDHGQLYLAVKDTERELLSATSIEASFITGTMDRSYSRRQVLVLDCCHSGAFGRSKGMLGASVGTAQSFEGKGYGRVVLTASDATQYAWDGDKVLGDAQTSVFTRYLIQGLRSGEADADADGAITLDELYDYIYEHVIAETPRQTPAKWSYRQQGTIVIGRNPTPVVQPTELPTELRAAIESPYAGIREGAVRELNRLLSSSDRGMALAARIALEELSKDDSRRVSYAAQAELSETEQHEPPLHQAKPAIRSTVSIPTSPQIKDETPTAEESQIDVKLVSTKPISAANISVKPFLALVIGYSLSMIFAGLLLQLTNDRNIMVIGWALGGLATGNYLSRGYPRKIGWLPSFILAGAWILSEISFAVTLNIYDHIFLASFTQFALAGLVNSWILILLVKPSS